MKVLLSGVFGPFGVDDTYGRRQNIIELFHNQITREQGVFSFRMFHQSFGLYFMAQNIKPPTVVLDFPTEARFVEEIRRGYDIVGISFIAPNYLKAKRMAELVREHAPSSSIVLGGHGVQIPEVEATIPHDHICRGEGVRFLRRLLGEDPDVPIVHPVLPASFGGSMAGVPGVDRSAHLCPGLGCPNACRFCCTSHFYDKTYTPYLETGQQIFDVCDRIERELKLTEFFVMDENFLLFPERARQLLELMERHGRAWRFGIFSSANTIEKIGVDFLARMGVTRVWVGVESKKEIYEKNRGIDIRGCITALRDHGISVIASGILFLEHHDKDTIWDDIKFMVGLNPDFIQFMQLGPLPRTKLYLDYEAQGRLRHDFPYEEWHGQHRIWFRHPSFTPEESEQYLKAAFEYDYNELGPSLVRMCETVLRGYRTLARYDDAWMRMRRENLGRHAQDMRNFLEPARVFAHNEKARAFVERVIAGYEEAFGPLTDRQQSIGRLAVELCRREGRRIAAGQACYQPSTIVTRFRDV